MILWFWDNHFKVTCYSSPNPSKKFISKKKKKKKKKRKKIRIRRHFVVYSSYLDNSWETSKDRVLENYNIEVALYDTGS